MITDNASSHPDGNKSRKQLLRELADLQRRLAAAERQLAAAASPASQAGQALRESEHRFALLFEKAPCPMALSGWEDGALIDVNGQWEKVFGYSRQESRGKTSAELGMIRDPQERARLQDEFKQRGALRELELSLFTRTGEERTCSTSVETVVLDGQRYRLSSVQDITERRRAEEALRHERDVLQAVMNGAPRFHLAYLDRSFTFVRVNETYARSCGCTPEEMVGKNHFTLFPDAENEAIFTRVRDSGEAAVFHDKPFAYPDQPQRGTTWWDWTLVPVKDREGRVEGLVLSLVETSERVRAEEALRESEYHLARAQQIAHLGSWSWDVAADRLYWSEETYRLFGLRPGEVVPSHHAFMDYIHRADRERVERCIQEAFVSGRYATEFRILRKGGEERCLASEGHVFHDKHGRPAKVEGSVQDITERKRSEEALRASEERFTKSFQYSPVPLAITRMQDGCIESVNDAALAMFGYRREEAIGKSSLELDIYACPADREEITCLLQKTGVIREREVDLRTKSGAIRQAVLSIILIEGGGNPFMLTTLQDITERKRSEEALHRLTETLEHQVAERTAVAEQRARQLQALALQLTEAEERERRRIADLLHDDLQQLLSASRFQLSVIRPALEGHSTAGFFLRQVDQQLEQSIEKSRTLSHDLSPAILRHSGLAAAVEWLAARMQESHGLAVTVDARRWQPMKNEAAETFLYRATQEMLLNAAKYAKVAQVQVALSATASQAEVLIEDHGSGFDPQILNGIGRPRTGFGLFSIRERAQFIGGSLLIESAPGQGTRLTLSIPTGALDPQPTHPSVFPARQEQARSLRSEPKATARYRVLLVDDHQVMRQGLASVLDAQPDIQVIGEASNGREAVELARQLRPNVVLMDIAMPEMDGIEATRLIKAGLPQVRVLGLSMLAEEEAAGRLLEAGAEAYLSKAGAAEALVEAIRGCAR